MYNRENNKRTVFKKIFVIYGYQYTIIDYNQLFDNYGSPETRYALFRSLKGSSITNNESSVRNFEALINNFGLYVRDFWVKVVQGCSIVIPKCPNVRSGCSIVRPGCSIVRSGCSNVRSECSIVRSGCPNVRSGCSIVDQVAPMLSLNAA